MRKSPPVDETKKNNVLNNINREKMGFFGSESQTIQINQAANGSAATADVNVSLPLWEVVIICVVVMMVFLILRKVCRHYVRKGIEKQMEKIKSNDALELV
jgi:flagellar biosynthesis/type III secretory pathway M-ring protein FliF/YscJ